jgi:hypothetical protein
MSGDLEETAVQPYKEPVENVASRAPSLRCLLAWRRTGRFERAHQPHDQRLARRVQEIIAGCGLIQTDYSIGGGRSVHIPQVVSVVDGPPTALHIELLPGQAPDDFDAHTSTIAFHLGVAEVRVIPLPPSMIRLELLPGPV